MTEPTERERCPKCGRAKYTPGDQRDQNLCSRSESDRGYFVCDQRTIARLESENAGLRARVSDLEYALSAALAQKASPGSQEAMRNEVLSYNFGPTGRELRETRKASKLTMGDMADRLGISVTRVSNIELDRATPNEAELAAYAALATPPKTAESAMAADEVERKR